MNLKAVLLLLPAFSCAVPRSDFEQPHYSQGLAFQLFGQGRRRKSTCSRYDNKKASCPACTSSLGICTGVIPAGANNLGQGCWSADGSGLEPPVGEVYQCGFCPENSTVPNATVNLDQVARSLKDTCQATSTVGLQLAGFDLGPQRGKFTAGSCLADAVTACANKFFFAAFAGTNFPPSVNIPLKSLPKGVRFEELDNVNVVNQPKLRQVSVEGKNENFLSTFPKWNRVRFCQTAIKDPCTSDNAACCNNNATEISASPDSDTFYKYFTTGVVSC